MACDAASSGDPGLTDALLASPTVDAGRAERQALEGFYGEFSLRVGLRDWQVTNARHEQLKLLVADALRGSRRGVRILDVGCGTGVMTAFMTRFGTATGVDYSGPAVRLATAMVPDASFSAGSLIDAGLDSGAYDLITLFDVLEHVPLPQRSGFADELGRLLSRDGTLVASTPHPRTTEWMRQERPELMQVVDEAVELHEVIELLAPLDLILAHYQSFDIERGGPQYQFMVFKRGPASEVPRPSPALARRLRIVDNRVMHRVRPWARAAHLALSWKSSGRTGLTSLTAARPLSGPRPCASSDAGPHHTGVVSVA